METIKDIVRELRELGASSSDGNIVIVACTIADRIEAAWKQDMMAFGRWMKERHNFNVLDEEMERCVERELEREYGDY